MKKCILSLISATFVCTTFAANCVSVQQISTDYAGHKITIAITRTNCTGDNSIHRNTVWVFVDYREVGGSSWTRATVSATSSGTVISSGSSKGAWIYGANGTQTVTLTLSGMPAKYDWCAFATDYPPNVVAAGGVYTFKGTPPFVLQPTIGTAQTVTQTTLAATSLAVAPVFIRDATGCTGTFCPYSGTDLYIDATHACRVRTDGAKNWEAWIKDVRDNKLYRMVYMPDNNWWFAQPLAHETGTYYANNNILYYIDESAGCPVGWGFPTNDNWSNLFATYGGTYYNQLKTTSGWEGSGYAGNGTDTYGLSLAPTGWYARGLTLCSNGFTRLTTAFATAYSTFIPEGSAGAGYVNAFGIVCVNTYSACPGNVRGPGCYSTGGIDYGMADICCFDQKYYKTAFPRRCLR